MTKILRQLRAFEPLAPLHQPFNLAGVEAAVAAFPNAAQVACFDTAFHRQHPYIADTFALPRIYYDEGVRRYGFHGLSYEFITRILRHEEPVLARGKVIVAHLGNGASLCAIDAGKSLASTMGFTALDGVPMGTRCGQLDPGVVLYLMSEKKMSAIEITDLLYKNSGLKGMSGISNDVRDLEASNQQSAKDAIDYFVSRVRREIGGLAAVLGGLDCIVLTGGIGENAVNIRHAILRDMEWFGVQIDQAANARNERVISGERLADGRADPENRRGADDRRPHRGIAGPQAAAGRGGGRRKTRMPAGIDLFFQLAFGLRRCTPALRLLTARQSGPFGLCEKPRADRRHEVTEAEVAERAPAAADPQEQARARRAARIKPVGVLILAAMALGGFYYWFSNRNIEDTDDAFIDGRSVIISPRVAGNVVSLDVTDNQFVHAGQVLLTIDPRQYRYERDLADGALATAKAQLAAQQYGFEVAQKNFPALLAQAQAQLASAKARLRQGAGRLQPPALPEQDRHLGAGRGRGESGPGHGQGAGRAGRGAGAPGLAGAAARRRG